MLPVPWTGTGTQEATHSANPGRGQGVPGGPAPGRSAWGEGRTEGEGVEIRAFQSSPGRMRAPWVLASHRCLAVPGLWQSRATRSHSPPHLGGGGGGRAQAGSR